MWLALAIVGAFAGGMIIGGITACLIAYGVSKRRGRTMSGRLATSESTVNVEQLRDWAKVEWMQWKHGRLVYPRGVCPPCVWTEAAAVSAYVSTHHWDPEIRDSWKTRIMPIHAKIQALGGCECPHGLTLAVAYDLAEVDLAYRGSFS